MVDQKDSLLGCLVSLTHHYNTPLTAEVLVDGLPFEGNITPELFIRSAKRAGFAAKMAQRQLSDISPLVMEVLSFYVTAKTIFL